MALYAGIDLHSNNSVLAVIDGQDALKYRKPLPNDLAVIEQALSVFREELAGVVIESTYNWYWLVDGLMDAGYTTHLAHTAAVPQYAGLKHGDDDSDARHLANLLRSTFCPRVLSFRAHNVASAICCGKGCGWCSTRRASCTRCRGRCRG